MASAKKEYDISPESGLFCETWFSPVSRSRGRIHSKQTAMTVPENMLRLIIITSYPYLFNMAENTGEKTAADRLQAP